MLKIQVSKSKQKNLINPIEMFKYEEGTVFQQYFKVAQKVFYVNCGFKEPLLEIWYNEEDKKYHISQETYESINGLVPEVKVKKVDMNLEIKLV